MSIPCEEGYPAVVPEEPEQLPLPEAVIVSQWRTDNQTKTVKIDPTEEGFKKIVLDTCSSVEEARVTVDEIFRALVKASVQYKLAKENLSNMGKLTTEQKKARANERRDEQQAQDRALREELCLNINSDFFDQYVLCIHGNDNIKTMKVRIVQQVFPQLVGNTAGAEKKIKDLTLYKNDVINPCDQPSHKKAVLADS